jgi:hypothetical protein
MALYEVTIPIAGSITFQIEAESREAAKATAFATDSELRIRSNKGDLEWEMYEHIASGHVLHAPINNVIVTLLEN